MRLGIILDPLEHIKTYKDSTFAIMREAAARGHALFVMEQQEVWLEAGCVVCRARKLDLIDDALRASRSRGMLFYRLMEQAVMTAPLPYRQIVQRKHNI